MTGYIGIDFGTTNIKAGMFDVNGQELGMRKIPTPIHQNEAGSYYDPDEIADDIRQMLHELRKSADQVLGIVVTGMAEAGIMLRKADGACMSDIIPWFDRRTMEYADRLSGQEAKERFYKTGLRNSFKYGSYKYQWCLDHIQVPVQETIWLSAVDYCVYLLTGHYVTDPTFAARTYAYLLEERCYDTEWLKSLGMTEGNFPEIILSGSYAGECIMKDYERVPVHMGAHDHICAAYGMKLLDANAICDSCGTAETYIGTLPQHSLTEQDFETGYIYGPYPETGTLFWMGNISSSGQSVEWFRRKLQKTEIGYEEIGRMLCEEQGPTGILYIPALTGMGTPCFRQDMTAMLLGLKQEHTSCSVLKAIVEGIAYQGRMILEPITGTGETQVRDLLSVGGAAHCAEWMQLKADITGMDVVTIDQQEATITGAIALMISRQQGQSGAMNFYQSRKNNRRYRYRTEYKHTYDDLFTKYKDWHGLYLHHMQ